MPNCLFLCVSHVLISFFFLSAHLISYGQLVNFVRKQQEEGAVWGCRHQGEVPFNCLYYFNRRVDYLCERYEPVTQHMCTRVNNAFACLHLLDEYCDRLTRIFGLDTDGDRTDEEDEENVWERVGGEEGRSGEVLQASDGGTFATTSSGTLSHADGASSSSGYLTAEAAFGVDQRDPGIPPQQPFPPGAKLEGKLLLLFFNMSLPFAIAGS